MPPKKSHLVFSMFRANEIRDEISLSGFSSQLHNKFTESTSDDARFSRTPTVGLLVKLV